jgi:hypothetical protein
MDGSSPGDALITAWVATVSRHDVPLISADGVVVTNRQIDALFVSNDWVAKAAPTTGLRRPPIFL